MDYYSPLEKSSYATENPRTLPLGDDTPPGRGAQTPQKAGWSVYHVHALVCIALHLFLILVHIALLVVCLGHYERAISFALTPFTLEWYSLAATTLVQVFGTIFLAILVSLTQSLAFRSDLYVRQTLTALHDKSGAWLGLGAAFTSLWAQFKLRAAIAGVMYITAYLFGVWLLHITIPTVLNVVPYNATVSTVHHTVLANATFGTDSVSAYDILLVYDQPEVPTLGLQDNMVYDVIPQVSFASGSAMVNASVYSVDCAALPSADPMLTGSRGVDLRGQPNMTWLSFSIDDTYEQGVNFSASLPYSASAIYTGQVINTDLDCSMQLLPAAYSRSTCWAPIVMLSTVAILDSAGHEAPVPGGPWKPIDPQVIVPVPYADPAEMITAVQLLACNVGITNVKVEVSVDTRTPGATTQGPQTDSTLWKNWTRPTDQELTAQLRIAQSAPSYSPSSGHQSSFAVVAGSANVTEAAPPVALPGLEPDTNPLDVNPIAGAILRASSANTVVPTAFDVFLTEDLRIASESRSNVSLAEVNHSLARALAATFWYGNNVNYSSAHAISGLATPLYSAPSKRSDEESPYGEATIMVLVQRLRLNLSLIPIVIGLVTSVGLLVLCILVTRVPAPARAAFDPRIVVDSGGLLQYTWLLGTELHLAGVESPELGNLRAAGMFDVHMSDRVRKRLNGRSPSVIELDQRSDYADDDSM